MMNEILTAGLAEWNRVANEEQLAQLEDFFVRVRETNKVMNLTAITEPEEFARKHFLDCASLLTVQDFDGLSVVDVGCGAGFPGMPLKLLCSTCSVTLLDSLGKRIRFLQDCIDGMGLTGIEAVHARAEEFAKAHRESYDCAVSRAVARLNVLAELSLPMVKVGGLFLAMKSKDSDDEIHEAERGIQTLGGTLERIQDITIPGTEITHRLVLIRKCKPTPARYPRRFQKIKDQPL
ncbi:MAG: 16S rRNA (guanine(527)-N(7))-methyltransferase RsmG [Eubacteriales bacterium]|nr:16S rRNA (guanine(527)-N(7))-methyltransferase RsmG [Eubacteriales bacterium]